MHDANKYLLVVNPGSSNVKYAFYLLDGLKLESEGKFAHLSELYAFLQETQRIQQIIAVGYRVVHGGEHYYAPIQITEEVLTALTKLIPLAPLHQPYAIDAINKLRKLLPDAIHVASFDTAFHTTQYEIARLYPLPASLTAQGIIRYGFHGLSYQYIASVLHDVVPNVANQKIVVAHLGGGASVCALLNLKSCATSMGFSALEGLMMGTRCGSIDPGILLYLMQHLNYNVQEISELLYNNCGLYGVSGISAEMRDLVESVSPAAKLAIDLFAYRAACEISNMITTLQGCNGIVFTGGIGENSPVIRQEICKWLTWIGIKFSIENNYDNQQIISDKESSVIVAVIPTNEQLVIAKNTLPFVR